MGAAILRAPDEAIVGASPDELLVARRGGKRVDDTATRTWIFVIGDGRWIKIGRDRRIDSRQIGTDCIPMIAAIDAPENPLIAKIKSVTTGLAEHER